MYVLQHTAIKLLSLATKIPYSWIFSREKIFANFKNFCRYAKILYAKKGGRYIIASAT